MSEISNLNVLFQKALTATGSTLSQDERRKRLEDIAWQEAHKYGPGAYHTHDGQRSIWAQRIRPGKDFIELSQLTDAELRSFGQVPPKMEPWIVRPEAKDFLKKKVTIYKEGEMGMGYRKIEASSVFHQVRPYAQYSHAHDIRFIPKSARSVRGYYETYKPTTIILEGWGHPDPASPFTPFEKTSSGIVTSKGRHSSFSDEWGKEFGRLLANYVAKTHTKILLDLRK